jgi:uncharacterized iron-regulated membrane protein
MISKKLTASFIGTFILFFNSVCFGQEAGEGILIPAASGHPSIWEFLLYVVIFGFAGIVILIGGYYLWELITPYNVKQQLVEHKNTAVAIVVAAFIIGMAIVIGSALILIK